MNCDASVDSKELPGTSFTVGWLLEKLVTNCDSFVVAAKESAVKNVIIERIAKGEGYLSHVYRYSIEFTDCRQPSFQCVAKIPLVHNFGVEAANEETKKKQHQDMAARHNRECALYGTFKDVDGLPLPRIFFAQTMTEDSDDAGMLVMEDLSALGTNPGPFVSVTVEQIGH
ncbi:hypothetical protein AAVH_26560 [Aphelenchoides avenae]|nr:hypothetical protein AAVH_26560 [Aphelenchus avenae]